MHTSQKSSGEMKIIAVGQKIMKFQNIYYMAFYVIMITCLYVWITLTKGSGNRDN